MKDFKALENLLAGYLHEDWRDEYESAWSAIRDFALSEPTHAPALGAEVHDLLERFSDEDDAVVAQFLTSDLGLGYAAEADGWGSYREWLLAVADRVDELLRGQPPEPPDRPRSGSAQV